LESRFNLYLMINLRVITLAATAFIFALLVVFAGSAFGQDNFEKALSRKMDSLLANSKDKGYADMLLPDDAPQAITVPSGFGGYGTYIFGVLGGDYPQVYHTSADLIASGGISFGDPLKAVNVAAGLNMTNIHRFSDFSGNLIVSRIVGHGSSVSAGALQLFATRTYSDSPGETFYAAFSHAVQSLPSATDGCSLLTYTIGVGNGRFYLKSPDDVVNGRGTHGTAVFGSITYEVFQHVNVSGEWDGVNLAISTGFRPFDNALSLGVGVTNLTRYSADKPDMIFSIGLPLSLNRQKE
jgi:hypothetical protein